MMTRRAPRALSLRFLALAALLTAAPSRAQQDDNTIKVDPTAAAHYQTLAAAVQPARLQQTVRALSGIHYTLPAIARRAGGPGVLTPGRDARRRPGPPVRPRPDAGHPGQRDRGAVPRHHPRRQRRQHHGGRQVLHPAPAVAEPGPHVHPAGRGRDRAADLRRARRPARVPRQDRRGQRRPAGLQLRDPVAQRGASGRAGDPLRRADADHARRGRGQVHRHPRQHPPLLGLARRCRRPAVRRADHARIFRCPWPATTPGSTAGRPT